MNKYLTNLIDNGLLGVSESEDLYKTTKKGQIFLENYGKIQSLLTVHEEINQTVGNIKKDAASISDENVRTRIIGSTEKLTEQVDKLEDEVDAVRKLIGQTQEFQDWRVLASDVHQLKEERVPRDLFESEIERLSSEIRSFEKIQQAYEKVLEQQSNFLKWIKYSVILVPVVVASVPVIEALLKYLLG